MSFAPALRPVRYTTDLLSPAELRLLRRAVIVREGDDGEELAIAGWEAVELPG